MQNTTSPKTVSPGRLRSSEPATTLLPEERIIDVIVYTASLISDKHSVDSLTDTLRAITAFHEGLSAADIKKLHDLQEKLEEILVNQEHVRLFSYESLHAHIQRHFSPQGPRMIKQLRLSVAAILALAVGLACLPLVPTIRLGGDEIRQPLAIAILYTVVETGAAALLWSAIKELSADARRAYKLIFISMIALAVSVTVQPMSGILGFQGDFITPTLYNIPLVISYLIFYRGVVTMARVAGVESQLLSARFLMVMAALSTLAIVITVVAMTPLRVGPMTSPYILSIGFFQGMFLLLQIVCTILLLRVRRRLSFLYTKPVQALMWAAALHALSSAYFMTYWLFGNNVGNNPYIVAGAVMLIAVYVLYLRASYFFKKLHLS